MYVPYLPNRTGRYKIPTPRVQFLSRAAKPQGEEMYPRGRNFISSPPDWVGKAFLCSSNSWKTIFSWNQVLQGKYDFMSKIHPRGKVFHTLCKNFMKIHSRGGVFPYLPCKNQNSIFGCLNYIGMPYLPNRVGRYKKPTPWVKFFPLRLRRAGKNLYPWGRYFIPPRPIG